MPLYEYQCDVCGHRFEKIQKYSDPLETTCPKCGGVVRKLVSSPAIQFKGSGFYITDYAKKDYVSASKADQDGGKGDGQAGKGEQAESAPKSDKGEKSTSSGVTSSSSSPAVTPAAAPAKSTAND
ncbi:MAG TPA: zinc ribbon domain-containing protein [Vicinamibacterales bacterium]|jgi:putative FmdB family regulatory protein|nr:zinc ribbon domain-containing protein [Vicinamibacterales bacterium]